MHGLVDWITHPTVLAVLGGSSVLLFVLGLVAVPWFVAQIPSDYFTREDPPAVGLGVGRPRLRWMLRALKNVLGGLLLLAGVLMLVLPGQGLLTIVASLFLIDFPGKRRLLRRLIHTPVVYQALNTIRKKAGRVPLERDPL